jgi:hypothetical protein
MVHKGAQMTESRPSVTFRCDLDAAQLKTTDCYLVPTA